MSKELVRLFKNGGWEFENDESYLPESHFDTTNKNYKMYTGGRLSFFKKQKLEVGKYTDYTTIEIFPKIDGFGVDFLMDGDGIGADFSFDDTEEIFEAAEETYKEHAERLEEY